MIAQNITRFRGDTKPLVLRLSKNNVPLDVTGCSFMLSAIVPANKGTADYAFQSEGVVDGSSVSFEFAAEDVAVVGTYDYDVEMTDADGKISTIVSGKWALIQDVTQ